jgi:beta-N-acetylhexosaminidase
VTSHRAETQQRRIPYLAIVAVLVLTLASGTAYALLSGKPRTPPSSDARPPTGSPTGSPTQEETQDPDTPTGWGPTVGELAEARTMVSDWTPSRLAGQVIVGRYAGYDPAVVGALVKRLHLAGVCVTADNVADADQVRATTQAVKDAAAADGRDFPPIIGIDEEGGVVEHLRGIATEFPPFAQAGVAITSDGKAGERVVHEAALATGLELRSFGFTWVFAPDADVTIGPADVTIGSRSPSSEPKIAARAVAAAVEGYNDAGLVSTPKHFPGHGAVTVDSHVAVPVRDVPLRELRRHDFPPFVAAVAAHAPALMMGHIDAEAISPGVPASMAPAAYDFVREDLGFQGVLITDSLGMGAVATRDRPALTAINAGADLLLMPANTAGTHAMITHAIEDGEITRERIEDAAARVVALQLWQQRVAEDTPVPADVTARAESAAAALAGAGS